MPVREKLSAGVMGMWGQALDNQSPDTFVVRASPTDRARSVGPDETALRQRWVSSNMGSNWQTGLGLRDGVLRRRKGVKSIDDIRWARQGSRVTVQPVLQGVTDTVGRRVPLVLSADLDPRWSLRPGARDRVVSEAMSNLDDFIPHFRDRFRSPRTEQVFREDVRAALNAAYRNRTVHRAAAVGGSVAALLGVVGGAAAFRKKESSEGSPRVFASHTGTAARGAVPSFTLRGVHTDREEAKDVSAEYTVLSKKERDRRIQQGRQLGSGIGTLLGAAAGALYLGKAHPRRSRGEVLAANLVMGGLGAAAGMLTGRVIGEGVGDYRARDRFSLRREPGQEFRPNRRQLQEMRLVHRDAAHRSGAHGLFSSYDPYEMSWGPRGLVPGSTTFTPRSVRSVSDRGQYREIQELGH